MDAREDLSAWLKDLTANVYERDVDLQHTVKLYFKEAGAMETQVRNFAECVPTLLNDAVVENNKRLNLPVLETHNGIGLKINHIAHHPSYAQAGDLIYGSGLLAHLKNPGGLLSALTLFFISSQVGEAGHHCPLACSAGIIRVLQKVDNLAQKDEWIAALCEPRYTTAMTGAQFLTEVQGGSDVGANTVEAYQDDKGVWRIRGEKWFCSNANADLMLVTARPRGHAAGTAGLALFMIPRYCENGELNYFNIRRLKEKIGTQSMASAEIEFIDAKAYLVGELAQGFKLVMENVLQLSRLFNVMCVLGMARRAYHIALSYAHHRRAFGECIIHYPLVAEQLALIHAQHTAITAAAFDTIALQDRVDLQPTDSGKLLVRLLANLMKYVSALKSVEHIHHSLDILAGNGAIETFSIIPRLLRDSIVCENWEGTHHVLRMQILRDSLKYSVDTLFFDYLNEWIVQSKEADFFTHSIKNLRAEFADMKQQPPRAQSLIIKTLIDEMAFLYSAVCLEREAHTSTAKTRALTLFLKKVEPNAYVEFISRYFNE